MTKTLLIFLAIYLSFEGFSQQVEKDKIYFLSAEQTRGTFQLEVTEEQFCSTNVNSILMEQIEKTRHTTDFRYISLTENSRIKIYPSFMIPDLKKNPIEPCLIVKDFRSEK
jgi:hypothetical protein